MHVRRSPVVDDRAAAGVRPLFLRPCGGALSCREPIFALVDRRWDAGPELGTVSLTAFFGYRAVRPGVPGPVPHPAPSPEAGRCPDGLAGVLPRARRSGGPHPDPAPHSRYGPAAVGGAAGGALTSLAGGTGFAERRCRRPAGEVCRAAALAARPAVGGTPRGPGARACPGSGRGGQGTGPAQQARSVSPGRRRPSAPRASPACGSPNLCRPSACSRTAHPRGTRDPRCPGAPT